MNAIVRSRHVDVKVKEGGRDAARLRWDRGVDGRETRVLMPQATAAAVSSGSDLELSDFSLSHNDLVHFPAGFAVSRMIDDSNRIVLRQWPICVLKRARPNRITACYDDGAASRASTPKAATCKAEDTQLTSSLKVVP